MTVQVPLGILLKNEDKGLNMVDILTHLHRYVPVKEYTKEVSVLYKSSQSRKLREALYYLVGTN